MVKRRQNRAKCGIGGRKNEFSNSGPKGRGESRRRPPVAGISSVLRSCETSGLPSGEPRRLNMRNCPAKPEERRMNQSKRAMRPLQGSSAKIEIAARSPSANSIVATPHCGACSLEFDLSSDEIPATGGRQSFAHFAPGTL